MSEEQGTPRTPLDQIASKDSMEIIKASIPYLPAKSQLFLSLYVKCMEINNLLTYFHNNKPALSIMSSDHHNTDPEDFLNELKKYARGSARDSLDSALLFMETVHMMSADTGSYPFKEDSYE